MTELAVGAIGFAEGDLTSAQRVLARSEYDDSKSRIGLRARFAVRRLESAQQQIRAALALLREESE